MPETILITRPRHQALAFAARLEKAAPGRFDPIISPLTEIRDLPAEPDLTGISALVFTSANAVETFARRWPGVGLPAFCAGPATAAAAARANFAVAAVAADGNSLLATLATQAPAGPILHPRGHHAAVDIVVGLQTAGRQARDLVIYDQAALPLTAEAMAALAGGRVETVLFFSRRAATLFAKAVARRKVSLAPASALCISPAVARAVQSTGFREVRTARQPDGEAMIGALVRHP